MTFDELVETAEEQDTRIFSIDCAAMFKTMEGFENQDLKELQNKWINNACWEALIALRFPFEDIIPDVISVFSESKIVNSTKTVTGVSLAFSIYILNRPEININDIKKLLYRFTETFDFCLTHIFAVPVEIKSSALILNLNTSHSFYKVLSDNHII